jgi:hypothetical protein
VALTRIFCCFNPNQPGSLQRLNVEVGDQLKQQFFRLSASFDLCKPCLKRLAPPVGV